MKIIYTGKASDHTISGAEIADGTTFTGRVGSVRGLFVKNQSQIVALGYSGLWNTDTRGVEVHDFVPVDITITVEGSDPSARS